MAAGLHLLGSTGAAAVSVRGVCRCAQLTERYFYESFAGRRELVVAVLDQVVGEARDVLRAVAASGPASREALMAESVAAVTDFVLADPRRGRVMFVETLADPDLARRNAELADETSAVIADVMRLGGVAPADDADSAQLRVQALAILGAATLLYQTLLDGRLVLGRDAFVAHVSHVLARLADDRHDPEAVSRSAPGAVIGTAGRSGGTARTRR